MICIQKDIGIWCHTAGSKTKRPFAVLWIKPAVLNKAWQMLNLQLHPWTPVFKSRDVRWLQKGAVNCYHNSYASSCYKADSLKSICSTHLSLFTTQIAQLPAANNFKGWQLWHPNDALKCIVPFWNHLIFLNLDAEVQGCSRIFYICQAWT